jgi:hypothetical protein
MAKRNPRPDDAPPQAVLPSVVVHPRSVWTLPAFRAAFGLRESTPRREIREGRLRVSKRGGRYYLLGRWILSWIEAGEVHRRPSAEANGQPRPQPHMR